MSLNPEDKKSWQGFLELLQPPIGYRLGAALGTTFGLSIEALVAALLSMCDADGEELAHSPVAAVMAITRLEKRVRVLVHPATITGPTSNTGSDRFVALLDRLVVEVQPQRELFHPKVWALRFEYIGTAKRGTPAEIGRVLIGSRNLTRSTCFELGASFDGISKVEEGTAPSKLSGDIARALREWLNAGEMTYPAAIWALPKFVGGLVFDPPQDAVTSLRFRWQGMGQRPLVDALPKQMKRAVVVSPFIEPDFVAHLLACTKMLEIVSIPESLDALSDAAVAALEGRAADQGSPVLYQVTDHGDPEEGHIDGIHAKLLLTEDLGHDSATFVGSANATGRGWGLKGAGNTEAMLEMRPGIGIDRFIGDFVGKNSARLHPWVSLYDRKAKAEPDQEKVLEQHMLAALREVARLQMVLRYDATVRRLSLSRRSRRSALAPWVSSRGLKFFLAPLLLAGDSAAWRPISELESGSCDYDNIPLETITAFVVVRAKSFEPPLERQRFVMARLEVASDLLNARDRAIEAEIMSTADPAMVLNALIRGLSHVVTDSPHTAARAHGEGGLRALLADTTLERLLQAVALDHSLVSEMRVLLGPLQGEPLLRLCADLDEVLRATSMSPTQ